MEASPSRKLLRTLKRVFSALRRGPAPERVHKLRTTTRRLEVLLACSKAPEKRRRKTTRLLKKLRRRAGKVRDVDVQYAALESVNIRREEELKAGMLSELARMRRKRAEKLVATLNPELWERLQRRLSALQATAGNAANEPQLRRALGQWSELREQWSRRRPETAEELHGFRIRCKRVRYAFELANGAGPAEQYIQLLKSMQDAIGEAHDWAVLTETTREHATPVSPLLAAVRTIAAGKHDDARRLCAATMEQLAGLDIIKRSPQTAAPSRPGPAEAKTRRAVA